MARQLEQQGQEVALLTLIDSQPPTPQRAREEHDPAAWLLLFAEDAGLLNQQSSAELARSLPRLDPAEQLAYLLGYFQELDLLPPDADLERLSRLFAVFQANMEANNAYEGRAYQHAALLLQADQRGEAGLAENLAGWSSLLANLDAHPIAGDHYSIIQAQAELVAAHMRRAMERHDR